MTLEETNSTPRLPKPFPNIPSNVLQQFSMSNKVTAITGASAGIGWAVSEAIAEAGGHVALLYNSNPEAIAKGLKLAELHHVQVKAYQLEVSDPKRVEETINRIVRDFGRLDVFVANAGMAISKPLTETSVEEYRRQMEVNSMFSPRFFPLRCWDGLTLPGFIADGVVYQAKYAGQVFKKQGFGNLIITASISAHIVNVPIDQPVSSISIFLLSAKKKALFPISMKTSQPPTPNSPSPLLLPDLQRHQSRRAPPRPVSRTRMARFRSRQHCLSGVLRHENGRCTCCAE